MKVFIVLFTFLTVSSAELPSSVVFCKRNDPQLDDCIKTSTQAFFQSICDENFAFPVDPLSVDSISANFEDPGVFGFNITFQDLKIFGISQSQVSTVDALISDESLVINANISTPILFLTAQSVGQVYFGSTDIDLDGQFNITLTDVDIEIRVEGEVENVAGVDYMRITTFNFIPRPETITFGVAGLDQLFVNTLDNNWQIYYDQLLPVLRALWEPLMVHLVDQIFALAPYDNLFPKN